MKLVREEVSRQREATASGKPKLLKTFEHWFKFEGSLDPVLLAWCVENVGRLFALSIDKQAGLREPLSWISLSTLDPALAAEIKDRFGNPPAL